MPFEAAWMQLEIIILSDMSEREQIPYDITSLWNLKYSTNEPIYERETDSLTQRTGEREEEGGWGQQMQTIINRMDKQQGPTV